jgi:hypothetical protein
VAPKGRFPDTGSSNIALLLQLHDADAKIGAADVGGDNGVVAVQHPGRCQLEAAEQASLVRMAGDRGHLYAEALLLEEHERAPEGEPADVAAAEAAADDDVLGLVPLVEPKESRGDRRQFAGKLLNGRVHETSCQRIVALKILVQL